MNETGLTLFELNNSIRNTLKISFSESQWVKAEIAQLKENYSGHCYLELFEKDSLNDKIIAQAKATIWSNTYRMLKPYFETTTGRQLTEGLKILICVKIDFHEVYGLSLNIIDIEPSYTVGDLALKKAETIKRLKSEGVFDINHEIELPSVPQRIAIISSTTAAGYKDFVTHLLQNSYLYQFNVKLFPAIMQGEKAEESIIAALEHINRFYDDFDAVVIIRGGGSQTDLSCFDNYWLASNVAQFPLPIITGIGHEQDDSVVDMVAHTRLKTPTAVAEFLINQLNNFENSLDELYNQSIEIVSEKIEDQKQILTRIISVFPSLIKDYIYNEKTLLEKNIYLTSNITINKIKSELHNQNNIVSFIDSRLKQLFLLNKFKLKQLSDNTKNAIVAKLELANSHLVLAENTVKHTNPEYILNKGYSITLLNNKLLKDTINIKETDIIETRLFKGKISSEVIKYE
jgi:exodeoxyribonuclease VII large subunit